MGNSDKQIGVAIFFIGSLAFSYYTLSALVVLLLPNNPTAAKYFLSYPVLLKIPTIGLVLFISTVGTCISLLMIKEALKDNAKHQQRHARA
ncbi:hypothetical protein PtA15_2A186 [Puccinia triticina]|uniref:Dolichol phosphate-mannose biosynthesis regulatory protein n=1 Tax=Puccinia triticina TaxID=208348 RepID=A0ABY7CAB9_9BASI|nr:uncharacterized protein PtA15_2A186 [Puccinia triticina]WAQ81873.1 hypothetical protein PtA15_2A186 [Puccinia triticina]WAR52759.1 hypothetical protein PtB15_2B184 [Puccinia triticina]